MAKPGRNSPCPCGSGRKYKQCCIGKDAPPPAAAPAPRTAATVPAAVRAAILSRDVALDDLMQEGYVAYEAGHAVMAGDLWLRVWSHVKARLTPEMRSVKDAEPVMRCPTQCLFNWCQDLEECLANAGLEQPRFNQALLEYCREFRALLPDTEESIIHNMKRAEIESLFRLGRYEEGERASEALVTAYPREVYSYINWGDLYHWPYRNAWPPDHDRAERLYRMALAADIDQADRALVQERLDDLAQTRKSTPRMSGVMAERTPVGPA
jgi:hypothetical protein